jgi:hypothetical protein
MLPVPVVSVVAVTAVPRVLLMSRLPLLLSAVRVVAARLSAVLLADPARGVEVHRRGRHQAAAPLMAPAELICTVSPAAVVLPVRMTLPLPAEW